MHSAQALASHLDAAAPAIASSPFSILTVIWNYLTSLAGGLIDTQEERDRISKMVMDAYDVATVAATKNNALIGAAFAAARPTVKAALDYMLAQFAPAPPPAPPVPVPVPVEPQGSAAP